MGEGAFETEGRQDQGRVGEESHREVLRKLCVDIDNFDEYDNRYDC